MVFSVIAGTPVRKGADDGEGCRAGVLGQVHLLVFECLEEALPASGGSEIAALSTPGAGLAEELGRPYPINSENGTCSVLCAQNLATPELLCCEKVGSRQHGILVEVADLAASLVNVGLLNWGG